MPETAACPSCGRQLQVPEGFQGRQVRCPACQSVFTVGAETAITTQKSPPPPVSRSDVQAGPPPEREALLRRRPVYEDDDHDDLPRRLTQRGEFKPAGGVTLSLKILLILNLVAHAALLLSNFLQYRLAQRLVAGEQVQHIELEANDSRQLLLGLVHLGLYVGTAIVFLIWFHRVHANLEPLGAGELTYTSGWAVGSWFVPFLNLVRPYQIAQEIWRNSDPDEVNPDNRGPSENSSLIGIWWAMWIISNIASNVSFRMSENVNTPQGLQSATAVGILTDVASIILTCLALMVVNSIQNRQLARAQALEVLPD